MHRNGTQKPYASFRMFKHIDCSSSALAQTGISDLAVADLEGGGGGGGLGGQVSSGNNYIARLIGYIWLMEHTNHL